MITVYGIKNCDTVRKARKWLESNEVEHTFHDFRIDGLSQPKLAVWCGKTDWNKLLNTRSTSWRNLDEQLKDNLSEEKAQALMLENPTLIKRPVLEHDDLLLVGFKESEYKQLV